MQPENYWINTSSNDALFKEFHDLRHINIPDLQIGDCQFHLPAFRFSTLGQITGGKGILGVKNRWGISSNREMGEGYADILAEPDTGDMGIIIEVKYAHDGDLDAACKEALKQIEYTRYEDDLDPKARLCQQQE